MLKISDINGKSEEYMRHVHGFVANPTGFFLISGTNGNGKTFTAQAIFDHFYDPMGDNLFWNQEDLRMKWQSFYAKFGCTDYLLNQLINAPLLVLDDIGTTKPTEAFMGFLYVVANRREKLKSTHGTIVTTNLNSEDLGHVIGGAFLSRVACGRCVRHDGEDRRSYNF